MTALRIKLCSLLRSPTRKGKKSHGTVLEIPNSDTTTPRQWTGQFSSQKFSSVNKRRNSPLSRILLEKRGLSSPLPPPLSTLWYAPYCGNGFFSKTTPNFAGWESRGGEKEKTFLLLDTSSSPSSGKWKGGPEEREEKNSSHPFLGLLAAQEVATGRKRRRK